jgi:hypothetical protein
MSALLQHAVAEAIDEIQQLSDLALGVTVEAVA